MLTCWRRAVGKDEESVSYREIFVSLREETFMCSTKALQFITYRGLWTMVFRGSVCWCRVRGGMHLLCTCTVFRTCSGVQEATWKTQPERLRITYMVDFKFISHHLLANVPQPPHLFNQDHDTRFETEWIQVPPSSVAVSKWPLPKISVFTITPAPQACSEEQLGIYKHLAQGLAPSHRYLELT